MPGLNLSEKEWLIEQIRSFVENGVDVVCVGAFVFGLFNGVPCRSRNWGQSRQDLLPCRGYLQLQARPLLYLHYDNQFFARADSRFYRRIYRRMGLKKISIFES